MPRDHYQGGRHELSVFVLAHLVLRVDLPGGQCRNSLEDRETAHETQSAYTEAGPTPPQPEAGNDP